MLEHELEVSDFEKAFDFAVRYYLDPKKGGSGRTSAEPRGLGAVIDNFILGKIVEIGTKNILESHNNNKEIILDFEIKSDSEVKNEPDIVGVVERGKQRRDPNIFVEIKYKPITDRWVGQKEDQLATIKSNSNGREIFFIYTSLLFMDTHAPKQTDLVGMYLKHMSGMRIFNDFQDLNCTAKLSYILSLEDLEKYGRWFNPGEFFFETSLFKPASITKDNVSLKSGIEKIEDVETSNGNIEIPVKEKVKAPDDLKNFEFNGAFELYQKKNKKTWRHYVLCRRKTTLFNPIFGSFVLDADKCYEFELSTIGRDPTLKKNNLWISARRITELISEGKIEAPQNAIKKVVDKI